MGLDWGAIRTEYEQKATPDELQAKPKRVKRGYGGSRPSYDRTRIVDLYSQGHTVSQIAQEVGCHRSAVYKHLEAAGVAIRDDRKTLPGRPRRTHCVKGLHPLDEKNTRIDCNGARHCRACEQERRKKVSS